MPKHQRIWSYLKRRRWIAGIVLVVIALSTSIVFLILTRSSPPKTPAFVIDNRVSFVTLLPSTDPAGVVRQGSVKYDPSNQSLSYVMDYRGTALTISQQAAPATFTDVPEYYTKWLASFGEYTSFGSSVGTVHLARSEKLNPYPFAIVNTNGTLMFAKPDRSLSDSDWRRFFNGLQLIKPS